MTKMSLTLLFIGIIPICHMLEAATEALLEEGSTYKKLIIITIITLVIVVLWQGASMVKFSQESVSVFMIVVYIIINITFWLFLVIQESKKEEPRFERVRAGPILSWFIGFLALCV